jgi:porin
VGVGIAWVVDALEAPLDVKETMIKKWQKRLIDTAAVSLIVLILLPHHAGAQTGSEDNEPGYNFAPNQTRSFGGPDGVAGDLERTYEDKESIAKHSPIQSYYDWKQRIQDEHGFSFGLNGYWLYQKASEKLDEEDDAWGQIYRVQGSWTLFGRGTGHPGRLEYRIEHRSNIGSNLSPSQLSSEIGIASLNSGFAYSPNFDWDLSVFNWTQVFNEQTAGFALGRLAFDVYLDAFPFQTFSRGFINRSFVLNPTLATTGIGALGAVAKGFVTDQIWIGGQIYDGNAVSGEFDIDTIEEGEWLKALEIGWAPGIDRYTTDRIQFTYWNKDAREQAGVPRGKGWAVSASWKLKTFFPFLRFGYSDGGAGVAAKKAASVGFEYAVRPDQAWSVGLGWAEPTAKAGQSLRDETVIETSYKLQLLKSFSLLPDVQLIMDPANNPDKDSVWLVGLRGILTL